MINIGRLDRKIVIENQTFATNSIGEYISTWAVFHTTFASVAKVSGSEKIEADQVTATNKVRFKIRFFNGIDETMRVLYNGNYYDIVEIQELDREGLFLSAIKKL
jgi:SPP1 family predicted phage head-tail adaptor